MELVFLMILTSFLLNAAFIQEKRRRTKIEKAQKAELNRKLSELTDHELWDRDYRLALRRARQ